MSFIIPPGCRSRQPINFGARVNPRYMARPEMVWVGGRSIGDKNGNFTRGSSLTDVAHGEAGLGIQFTGSTTNAYTRSGGSTVAQADCTFVSVFSWTSGAANYRPQLCSFSSANNSYRIGPTVDAGGDLALVLSGVVVPVSVSITSGVTYVLVTSRQKSTGNCYMVAKPLGGGAVARSVASNTSAALAGNGTSCVGYAVGGGSACAWNGNIYLVAGSYEWMPESLARELLDDPYSLFRAPQRLFAAAAATGGSFNAAWACGSNAVIQPGAMQ